jgi:hypothetical protein
MGRSRMSRGYGDSRPDSSRFTKIDYGFLPSLVPCIPLVYVDWFDFDGADSWSGMTRFPGLTRNLGRELTAGDCAQDSRFDLGDSTTGRAWLSRLSSSLELQQS